MTRELWFGGLVFLLSFWGLTVVLIVLEMLTRWCLQPVLNLKRSPSGRHRVLADSSISANAWNHGPAGGEITTRPALMLHLRDGPTRCPYCHDGCDALEAGVACQACAAPHHKECWAELGACAGCSCAGPPHPPVEARASESDSERLSR